MVHAHDEITDADAAELLKQVQARVEVEIAAAQARDSRVCLRCIRLGGIIGQILWCENMIGMGLDMPELHAQLQMLYVSRDAAIDHRAESTVIQ